MGLGGGRLLPPPLEDLGVGGEIDLCCNFDIRFHASFVIFVSLISFSRSKSKKRSKSYKKFFIHKLQIVTE
jgi:hypothetical protein